MTLPWYPQTAHRLLGRHVARAARKNSHLRLSLQRAHIPLRPEVYLASGYLTAILAFLATGLVVLGALLWAWQAPGEAADRILVALVPVPLAVAVATYLLTLLSPDLRASRRGRDIDTHLPYALNYMSTMAAAGVLPDRMLISLAGQPAYGEVAEEAAWISRDLRLLGHDLITALRAAIRRSPSARFQDLLQGLVTALTAGKSVKEYLLTKGQQYLQENRQDQRRFLDTLGVIAESYVTVVVAAPLFLIVLLTVFVMFGSNPERLLLLGYVLVLLLLPVAQFSFAATIRTIARGD